MVALGELVDIKGGGTPDKSNSKYWNGDIPWASVKDFKKNTIDSTLDSITHLGVENSATKIIPAGVIIIPTRMALGKVAINTIDIAINQDLKALFIKDNNFLDRNYLFRWLESQSSFIESEGKGATVKGITLPFLKGLNVPIPPINEQKRIASILDKADVIRQKREQAIKVANDYLYSVFLDMFGDPVMNPKGFEIRVLSDFFIDEKNGTKCGPFGSALKKDEYTSEGVPVWNMDNITLKGDFIDLPSVWVSENKYQALESYSVLDGDVIISRAGTVGKMGVVRSITEKSIISTNLIRVRFGEKLYPEYFVSLMTYCKGRVGNLKTGPDGTFTHMNTGVLSNLEFPYPPLELQKKYIKIRQSVMLIIDKYHHFGFRIDETFCAINQTAFLCQP